MSSTGFNANQAGFDPAGEDELPGARARRRRFRRRMLPYLFILPWILGVVSFQAYPILGLVLPQLHDLRRFPAGQVDWVPQLRQSDRKFLHAQRAVEHVALRGRFGARGPRGRAVAGAAAERQGARAAALSHLGDRARHCARGRRGRGLGLHLESLDGADQQPPRYIRPAPGVRVGSPTRSWSSGSSSS